MSCFCRPEPADMMMLEVGWRIEDLRMLSASKRLSEWGEQCKDQMIVSKGSATKAVVAYL